MFRKPMTSDYGPYFVANWVTGTKPPKDSYGVRASTTIYYTLDTFDPYGQLIMRSTILGPRVAVSRLDEAPIRGRSKVQKE
jgi:hypothetical protein